MVTEVVSVVFSVEMVRDSSSGGHHSVVSEGPGMVVSLPFESRAVIV